MPIERLRVRHLPPEERADLESALKDFERFCFENREVFVAAMAGLAALLMILEVWVLIEFRHSYREAVGPLELFEGFFSALPSSLQILWQPGVLLFVASNVIPLVIVAIVCIIIQAVRTGASGRRGHALTSFGVVRIHGNSLRLLRYADIAEARVSKRVPPLHQHMTDVLEVFDKDGNSLVVYSFGVGEWKPLIDARRSAARPIDDPGRR